MSNDLLLFEKHGHIAKVTINRPDKRNPLGLAGDGDQFHEMAKRVNDDFEIRCLIMTGAGSAFSAGGDLKAMRDRSGEFGADNLRLRDHYRSGIHGIIKAMWNIEVPIVGAINGPAIGLGGDVASLCDIRLSAASAKFGATFLKIGLLPGDGGAWLLPRIVGWSRAAQLYFTGDMIDAETARDWGLVSEVYPDDQLMAEASTLAAKISQQPPQALRMTKRLMREGVGASFDSIMEMSAAMQVLVQRTDDHAEALNAFFEKRPPLFTGK